jgi:hypothetical protein
VPSSRNRRSISDRVLEESGFPRGNEGGEALDSPPTVASLAESVDRPKIEQLEPLGTLDRPREPALIHDLREIKQGAGDRGDRDALLLTAIVSKQRSSAVNSHPLRPPEPTLGDGHIESHTCVRREFPQRSCASVAQHGVGSTCQDGSHPLPVR